VSDRGLRRRVGKARPLSPLPNGHGGGRVADDEDRSEEFRGTLVDLAARRPEFQLAIERLDHPEARW